MTKFTLAAALFLLITVNTGARDDAPYPGGLAEAVIQIETLDAMRSGLAGTFGDKGVPADESTFVEVCKPVGMKAKQISESNGWIVKQMAEKYRNPAHKLDAGGEEAYRIMDQDPDVMGLWTETEMDGKPGVRYFRRIVVEEACLACHGEKESRPEFIKEKYPEDKAYGFKAGDLRGIYSVFIPEQVQSGN